MTRLRRIFWAAAMALAFAAPQGAAQESAEGAPTGLRSLIVTVDQERLFRESELGQSLTAAFEEEAAVLAAENRQIEAELEVEEQDLTERRATLSNEEFRALAAAFDEKVTGLRAAQDAKARDLLRRRERAPQTFFQEAGQTIAVLARESGAIVVLEARSVLLSAGQIDITDAVILRLNQRPENSEGEGSQDPDTQR